MGIPEKDTPPAVNNTKPPAIDLTATTSGLFSKVLKPILGKLAWIGVILILLFIVIKLFLGSIQKDHTIELMRRDIDAKEKERLGVVAIRDSLESFKLTFKELILNNNHRDSILKETFSTFSTSITNIKNITNEKVSVIEHYNSTDLELYYHTLPDDY